MSAAAGSKGFDLKSAIRKLEHYCRAAGVGAHLIDDDGTVLAAFDPAGRPLPTDDPFAGCCELCRLLGAEEARNEIRTQLYGVIQAERFGGKYIQLCPHSLLTWVSPIIIDGVLRGAYIGGPAMVMEPAELLSELASANKVPAGREAEARELIASAPHITPQRANSLAELLADTAAAAGGPAHPRLEANREREDQAARISEYIHEMKLESRAALNTNYPIEKERELLNAISRGSKQESQSLLNEILGHIFFSSGQDPAIIRARVLELVVLLSRAALDGGADIEQIFGLNFTYLNHVQKMRSVDDIAHWLSRIMIRFTDLVFNLKDIKHADVMMKALKYINARYTGDITLDEVAAAVFLSPTYFSKLFNEEMKCRFTTYLNRLRIEKSMLLLRSTDLPLVEIAGLVGYEDQSYFTKVFSKVAGTPPGRYRESKGRPSSSQEIHDE
jgi:AraC-like DNA-binding protein/ligand-binding sensor protein